MARIRTIKPEFFKHYDLWEAEQEAGLPLRIAFAGLWTIADREGRFKWKPPQLKIEVIPYDDVDFSRVLDALATRGFVVRYAMNGEEYGYIPSWHKHQVVNNRERPSELPEPPETAGLTREARVDDASGTPLVHAQAEQGREGKGNSSADSDEPASHAKPSKQKTGAKKRTQVPADWEPSDTDRQYARKKGLTDAQIKSEAEKFVSHHRSRGNLFADVPQGWRTWVQKAIEFSKPPTEKQPKRTQGVSQEVWNEIVGGSS